MTHIYRLSLDASCGDTEEVTRYLLDHRLATNLYSIGQSINSQEEVVMVEVPNKKLFESYLKKKTNARDSNDPRNTIKVWKYEGVKGKSAGSSKEGRLVSTRVRRFKQDKRNKRI